MPALLAKGFVNFKIYVLVFFSNYIKRYYTNTTVIIPSSKFKTYFTNLEAQLSL